METDANYVISELERIASAMLTRAEGLRATPDLTENIRLHRASDIVEESGADLARLSIRIPLI